MNKIIIKNSIYWRNSFLYFIVFFLIFLYTITSINISVLRNFYLFADIATQDLLSLINEQRVQNGLLPLASNAKLDQASYLKAQDMVKNDYFAHYSPQGVSPWYWFDQAGYYYQYAGENLAIDFVDAKTVTSAWMDSPLHRDNILNKNYTETGIAMIQVKTPENEDRIILVQTFGSQFKKTPTILPSNENKDIVSVTNDTDTTTTTIIANTTLASDVLGVAQVKIENETYTAKIRTEQEAQNTIKQILADNQGKIISNNAELKRISLLEKISSNDRIKYFSTAFFNGRISKLINSFSGISLVCVGITQAFIVRNKKDSLG